MTVAHHRAMRRSLDRGHGAPEPDPVSKRCSQPFNVVAAATRHRSPHRPIIVEEAMIIEERHEILGRKVQHLAGRRRPDRSTHRAEIVGEQPRYEWATLNIFTKTESCEPARGAVFAALMVEGQDVAQR